ncbi:hypothetical protein Y032_0211g2175 [Ancylostoma ceylanicum]|uniref:Uncharacterized protein n=1 Tax=Ancylostoma ceylanicum TaxID=53326 RepID=A0A016SKX3_9BILA|nr:hypothetical protein Y032_0211g2175 [Ancylostoma ceylanicum]
MALTFAPKEYRALEAAVHTNQQDALIPVGVIGAIPAVRVNVLAHKNLPIVNTGVDTFTMGNVNDAFRPRKTSWGLHCA